MDIVSVLNVKNAVRLGGLLLFWVAIVIVCLNFDQAYWAFLGGNMLLN